MNILFWNTYRNKNRLNVDECLIELTNENDCDLVILAEYPDDLNNLCHKINVKSNETYKILPNNEGCDHIKGFIKKKYKIESLLETTRYQIFKLETVAYTLLIGAIHNLSKWNSEVDAQRLILSNLHDDIKQQEDRHKTKNSIILGDFNANPFDRICVQADSLFAIPYRSEVERKTASRNGIEYEKFYNPTWKFLGNEEVPYTSYYYDTSSIVDYYWNMFDQVIIRPHLIDAFDKKKFNIITKTENHNLVYGKRPNKENYSDHLPIFCELKEDKIQ